MEDDKTTKLKDLAENDGETLAGWPAAPDRVSRISYVRAPRPVRPQRAPTTDAQTTSQATPEGGIKPIRPTKTKTSTVPESPVETPTSAPTPTHRGNADNTSEELEKAGERIAQLEKELKKSRKISYHYKDLFEKSPIGIYRTTPEGKIVLANEAAYTLLGYESLEELSGHWEKDDDPLNAGHRAEFQKKLASGKEVSGHESAWARSDGKTIFIRENARAVKNDQGQVLFYEGTIEDISEHKRVADDLNKSFERLSKTFRGIVDVLSLTLERRDPYAVGHQRRVAKLAKAISDTIGYDTAFKEGLEMAALVHDVGKLFIPAEILCKPGKLSTQEYALVRLHPAFGYELLQNLDFGRPIADIVHQHHEVLDGTGYPLGIKGPDILAESRILVVADVVEAMSGKRPHRPSKSIETALDFIQKHRDIKFDPIVVDACLYLFKKTGFSFDD